MSSKKDAAISTATTFFDLLNEENQGILLTLPKNALNNKKRAVLKRYLDHFDLEEIASPDDAPSSLTGGERNPSPKRAVGRPRKQRRSTEECALDASWSHIRLLIDLSLDDVLASEIAQWEKTGACQFLTCQPTRSATQIPSLGDVSLMERLAISCNSLKGAESSMVVQHVRWLFLTLLVGDLAAKVFESGFIVTENEKGELRQAIKKRFPSLATRQEGTEGDEPSKFEVYILKTVAMGERLRLLCELFTTGSLFWLQDVLTKGFINSRMTTKSGTAYGSAINHLRELKLVEKAKESRATALGDTIRRELSNSLRLDEIAGEVQQG